MATTFCYGMFETPNCLIYIGTKSEAGAPELKKDGPSPLGWELVSSRGVIVEQEMDR